MADAVTARLEAVAARLERVAARMGGGGGGDDDGDAPFWVADYEAIVKTQVAAVATATNELGIKQFADLIQAAYANSLALIKLVPNTKKPAPADLSAFLQPGIAAIQSADNLRYKGKQFKKFGDHYKALYETIVTISWVTMAPPNGLPAQHCEGQAQSADFNLNRVLKNNKDQKTKDWIKAIKALNKAVTAFVKSNFKSSGLTWNPKGKPLGDAKPVETASYGGADDQKSAPKKAAGKKKAGGGMDNVFASLQKGTGITKGMKKVTKDMKTKNRKVRTGKVTVAAKKAKGRKKFGPPGTKFQGGRWMVENYDEGIQTVDKCQVRQNVFITMCDNCVIQIPTKVKAVTIDNCRKCRIFISEVVSTVEVVNCQSVKLIIQKRVPSIAVDKCESPLIILTKEAFVIPPEIITSNVTAMNIEIPGKTDNDDPQEIPVPEQFVTKIDPKTRKATTSHTEH